MKVYFAGVFSGGSYEKFILDPAFKWRKLWKKHHKKCHMLESYHYIQNKPAVFDSLRHTDEKIFLDSGAFSLFTQGVDVDLDAYAEFIHENKERLVISSNLDHIGGKAAKRSYMNQQYLESLGVQIAPVHHARDKDKWLKKYIDEGYEYISLGGMVPEGTGYLRDWLDHIWDTILTDKDGKPKVKVHGFGLTTQLLMIRYPWYSVDSTTWMLNAAFGGVWIPVKGAIYKVLMYSSQSPTLKTRGAHYQTISDIERKEIDKLTDKYGFKKDDLRNVRDARALFNLRVMLNAEKKFPWPKRFIPDQPRLF